MVVESVASSVSKEIEAAFKEYYQASPEIRQEEERKRKEEEMTRLVGDQRFNSAFELALSTSDLKLVMYLCGQVNADFVFEKTPCPLSQPVLLSLIQQLSVELQDQLELKIKWDNHPVCVCVCYITHSLPYSPHSLSLFPHYPLCVCVANYIIFYVFLLTGIWSTPCWPWT